MNRRISGFSIIELLMVFAVGSLVLAAVSFMTGQSLSSSRQQVVQVRATEDARLHLQRMAGVIRSARPVDCDNNGYTESEDEYWLQQAAPNDLSVLADVDGDGDVELVRFYIPSSGNTNELHQQITEPNSTCVFPSTPTVDRVLLTTLANGTTPLFTFYSGADNATDEVAPTHPSTDITLISRVRIQLLVSITEGAAAANTDLVTDVAPRAIPCLPSECTRLVTDPVPIISLVAWPAANSDARGPEITVGDGTNIVLQWDAQLCDDTPLAANDHGDRSWDGNLTGVFGQRTLGPLVISQPSREYTVTCSNAYGSTTARVHVIVAPTPSVTLSSTSGSASSDRNGNLGRNINQGDPITLDWSVTNCDGTPMASNNTAEVGFAEPFGGWDGPLDFASGSIGFLFPDRSSPSFQPPVYFTLACTTSQGITTTTSFFFNDAVSVPSPGPEIFISGTYRGQPVRADTVVSMGEEIAVTWSSSNCDGNQLTASGSWSGTKGAVGSEPFQNNFVGITHRLTLSCNGAGGFASATLRFRTTPNPSVRGCWRDNWLWGWHSTDGGCAYVPDELVWSAASYVSGVSPRDCRSRTTGGRSDWQAPSIDNLETLRDMYGIFELRDLLSVGAGGGNWWSRERLGTAFRVRDITANINSTLEPVKDNYARFACVAPLREGFIWDWRVVFPDGNSVSGGTPGSRFEDIEFAAPIGSTFDIVWEATENPACTTLLRYGPLDIPGVWNGSNGSTPSGSETITISSANDYGRYVMNCVDASGERGHSVTVHVRPGG